MGVDGALEEHHRALHVALLLRDLAEVLVGQAARERRRGLEHRDGAERALRELEVAGFPRDQRELAGDGGAR